MQRIWPKSIEQTDRHSKQPVWGVDDLLLVRDFGITASGKLFSDD